MFFEVFSAWRIQNFVVLWRYLLRQVLAAPQFWQAIWEATGTAINMSPFRFFWFPKEWIRGFLIFRVQPRLLGFHQVPSSDSWPLQKWHFPKGSRPNPQWVWGLVPAPIETSRRPRRHWRCSLRLVAQGICQVELGGIAILMYLVTLWLCQKKTILHRNDELIYRTQKKWWFSI